MEKAIIKNITVASFLLLSSLVFIRPTFPACLIPTNDMLIDENVVLCEGTYKIPDTGSFGVLRVNKSNVTIDCNGALLQGNGGGSAIFCDGHDNFTIRNCNIRDYNIGINIKNSSSSKIVNNIIENSKIGIGLDFVLSSLITFNNLFNNNDGIVLNNSGKNKLAPNISCGSHECDIKSTGSSTSNIGSGNECDKPCNWSDANIEGCSYKCKRCADWDIDGICDEQDNCRFIANTDQKDVDSDGVGDLCDNCMLVYNPRSSYSGIQNDFDIDGIGDVCDNCWKVDNIDQKDADNDCQALKKDGAYWDGNKWEKDPHCGDRCDNCPAEYNPEQTDGDFDSIGDICDNCPEVPNIRQSDKDGDGIGDYCDNCINERNPNQANRDHDYRGDVCDNCPDKWTSSQRDKDGDGIGDACDNCWDVKNNDQNDYNGDYRGDACDCWDGFMGPNEIAADCGWDCGSCKFEQVELLAWLGIRPWRAVPVLFHGSTEGKIDIVFMMAQDYNNNWQQFRADIVNLINNGFFANPTIRSNKNKFNFYYVPNSTATVNVNSDNECQWTPIDWWILGAPQADMAAIIHRTGCRDYAQGNVFSTEPTSFQTCVHESGHGLFGLADEYDDSPGCDTSYFQPQPFPNIFRNLKECEDNSTYPDSDCDYDISTPGSNPFTTCQGSWWKAQPDSTVMDCGSITNWEDDAIRQVNHVLSKYVDPPMDEKAKVIIVKLFYEREGIKALESVIVYGHSPERFVDFQGLRISSMDSFNEIRDSFTIRDPRYRDFVEPPGADQLPFAEFYIVAPFRDDIKKIQISDTETDKLLIEVDLSDAIKYFCEKFKNDPQCVEYKRQNK